MRLNHTKPPKFSGYTYNTKSDNNLNLIYYCYWPLTLEAWLLGGFGSIEWAVPIGNHAMTSTFTCLRFGPLGGFFPGALLLY